MKTISYVKIREVERVDCVLEYVLNSVSDIKKRLNMDNIRIYNILLVIITNRDLSVLRPFPAPRCPIS